MSPLVSVIIPVYNAEKFLADSINAVINQTWKNIEIIIVDDGSKDSSLKVAERYKADNLKVISQPNSGASVARNRGLREANGDYIQFLDADDRITPEKIEGQINVLNGSQSHVSLCQTKYFYDDKPNVLLSPRENWYYADYDNTIDFLMKLYAGNDIMPGFGGMIQPNAWLTPRALIDKAGMWSEIRSPDDDGEFFCRVILASDGIKYSDKGFNYYRRYRSTNASLSSQKSLDAYEKILLSVDLKYAYLKAKTNNTFLDKIFARQYWWVGVSAYPMHKKLSEACLSKALALGYTGKKYVGGPIGHRLAGLFGWKAARHIVYLEQVLKNILMK